MGAAHFDQRAASDTAYTKYMCKEAFEKTVQEANENLTPNIREKIYPSGVKRVTYSPQTESVYFLQ